MLIDQNNSALLVIDVQTKLLGPVHESAALVRNCEWLIKLAQLLEVPVLATEQYPQGLGPTAPELRELLTEQQIYPKTVFSCLEADNCQQAFEQLDREQYILCGMEAHVCVLQTALGLQAEGKHVFVVADAISSRSPQDRDLAMERMAAAGISIVTKEMVGFEWVRRSDMPQFKTFSKEFLR